MDETSQMTVLLTSIYAAVRLATPLSYAAFGGYFSERSGVVNIGLEGMMLIGCFTSAAVAVATHSPWLGVLGGILGAMVLATLHAFLSIVMRADQIISGIAVNLLAVGIPPVVCKALYDMSGGTPEVENAWRIQPLFGISPLVLGIFAFGALLMFVHKKTRFGQYIRFAGEHPTALESQGISVRKIRWIAVLLSGAFCGLAGAYLSIDHGSGFSRNMTAGRGFIALAALIIGRWTPHGGLFAALVFGLIEALQILLQGATMPNGMQVPVQWIQMIPYIATLIILAGAFGLKFRRSRAPAALGQALCVALIALNLGGCIFKSEPAPKKTETPQDAVMPTEDRRTVNAEFLKELYRTVLLRDIKEAEFNRLMNVLDQGGHYEGVYNGVVYSEEYREKEKGIAPAAVAAVYSTIMGELRIEQQFDPIAIEEAKKNEERPDVPKPTTTPEPLKTPTNADKLAAVAEAQKEALNLSLFTLKKKLGEELLKTIDYKKVYKEKFATWYGKFTAARNAGGMDFGLPQRNNKDEYYHYRWALNADEDRLKWESLHRVHVLMNNAVR